MPIIALISSLLIAANVTAQTQHAYVSLTTPPVKPATPVAMATFIVTFPYDIKAGTPIVVTIPKEPAGNDLIRALIEATDATVWTKEKWDACEPCARFKPEPSPLERSVPAVDQQSGSYYPVERRSVPVPRRHSALTRRTRDSRPLGKSQRLMYHVGPSDMSAGRDIVIPVKAQDAIDSPIIAMIPRPYTTWRAYSDSIREHPDRATAAVEAIGGFWATHYPMPVTLGRLSAIGRPTPAMGVLPRSVPSSRRHTPHRLDTQHD